MTLIKMKQKNTWNNWIWIIIVWFIIISNFPWLVPFVIFWVIMYIMVTQKGINTKTWDQKKDFDFKNFDANKLYKDVMDSEFMQNYKIEEQPKSKITRPVKSNEFTKSYEPAKSYKLKSEPVKSFEYNKPDITKTLSTNSYKPKYKAKKLKTKYSSLNKKQKIYEYDWWKSIWDDYETVVDKLEKDKRLNF